MVRLLLYWRSKLKHPDLTALSPSDQLSVQVRKLKNPSGRLSVRRISKLKQLIIHVSYIHFY
jgi:hypothetical protein